MTERAIILCKGNLLGINDFPLKRQRVLPAENNESLNLKNTEIALIRKALKKCKYVQQATADELGITRDALIRKMKKYEIIVQKGE